MTAGYEDTDWFRGTRLTGRNLAGPGFCGGAGECGQRPVLEHAGLEGR